LSEDGKSYSEVIDDPAALAQRGLMAIIEQLLACPPRMLTRFQILKEWPRRLPPLNVTALWRALDTAVKSGQLRQEGAGRRHDPFRYGLPGIHARWRRSMEETLDMLDSE
jgi:hypothetical protein